MVVKAERAGSTVVVDLEGRLAAGADTRQLHELVRSTTELGANNVVLNLGNVWLLDSWGIGQLVQLYNLVHRSGGAFMLVNVEERQKRLLGMVGLLTVLRVADSRQEAIMGCGNAAALGASSGSPGPSAHTGCCSFDTFSGPYVGWTRTRTVP